jgi:hypothetical protein
VCCVIFVRNINLCPDGSFYPRELAKLRGYTSCFVVVVVVVVVVVIAVAVVAVRNSDSDSG